MLTYKYIARDAATGHKIKAEVQAENKQAAAKLIIAQGYSPIDIEEQGVKSSGIHKFFNKIKTKEKILFTRQLATLINAGLPLVQSLRNVAAQTTNKRLQSIINDIIVDIEAGSSFSDSLSKHPDVFNQVFISLIAAGEASGTLDSALERLSNQQEKDAEVVSKVRGAMVYPIIVLLVMGGVITFMLVMVLPQVKTLYDGMPGATLPLTTRILLAVSELIIRFWYVFILIGGLFGFFGFRWLNTLGGKRFGDKAKMRMWPIGRLFMKLYMARFARTSTTLIASGVPLVQVLEITAVAINNVHIEESISRAIEKVKGGKALSTAIEDDPNFLNLVPNMLRIGEQSGSVEQMTAKIAEYYEKELDTEIRTISTIIEPALMILLGLFAFVIVAAVLLPIYSLAGQNMVR